MKHFKFMIQNRKKLSYKIRTKNHQNENEKL